MSDILLSAHDLTVRFGGVLAVNQVSFNVKHGEVFTLIGPRPTADAASMPSSSAARTPFDAAFPA